MAPVQTAATAVPAANIASKPSENACPASSRLPEKSRERIVDELLEDAFRRERIAKFVAAKHEASLELAWRVTRNWDLAETAVSNTCLELWRGKTSIRHFFRALKMNARDLMTRRAAQRERFESLETLLSRQDAGEADLETGDEPEDKDFDSHRVDDQDPLEILIRREQAGGHGGLLRRAMSDPRWRYIKRRQWARPLSECAELAS